MSYQEEERTRVKRQSSRQAINLAMQGRWQEAVAANKTLLESFPNDIDAYNRLGRAYMELGDYAEAKASYEKAIELDPYNSIAEKNLARLVHLGEAKVRAEASTHKVEPQQFIEEVGKAGVVNLHHLAPPVTLAKMVAGDKVSLKINGPALIVENEKGESLGQVEPKHGPRLIKLMDGGNKYTAAIVSAVDHAVTVIVREVFQDPSQAGRLSFPPKGMESFRTYAGDRILRRELELEEARPGEPSYTIVGSAGEPEVLPEESTEETEEEEEGLEGEGGDEEDIEEE